jgi:aromatic ring-opening dioxygenase LigB subunit
VVSLIRDGDGLRFSDLGSAFAREAKADSYWQMLMLEGALGHGWKGELLSYEAPTYFGMLCAIYAQRAS